MKFFIVQCQGLLGAEGSNLQQTYKNSGHSELRRRLQKKQIREYTFMVRMLMLTYNALHYTVHKHLETDDNLFAGGVT
jgi:hypothetical protein